MGKMCLWVTRARKKCQDVGVGVRKKLIHSLNKYICFVPHSVLEPRITAVDKRPQNFCWSLNGSEGSLTEPGIEHVRRR